MGTRRSTTGLESTDLGERSKERRGRAVADGGELGSDLNGPPPPTPLLRERGVDGVPPMLLLVAPGVEGRWMEDGVDGRWLDDGVLGRPLLMGDSFGPDLDLEGSIVDMAEEEEEERTLHTSLFALLRRRRRGEEARGRRGLPCEKGCKGKRQTREGRKERREPKAKGGTCQRQR